MPSGIRRFWKVPLVINIKNSALNTGSSRSIGTVTPYGTPTVDRHINLTHTQRLYHCFSVTIDFISVV